MIILGIDPGVATVGFGIINDDLGTLKKIRYGTITTPPKMRLALRLFEIHTSVSELIDLYNPNAIAVEELFFNTNQKTALSVAHGRAAVLLAGEQKGVKLFEYTPLQVKKAVTGYGQASKTQVMDMVKRLLSMDNLPRPDDAADALAIAICHAQYAKSLMNIDGETSCSTI